MEQPFDLAAELAKQPHLLEIAGNLLMKGGPEDYIGAVLCLRGTLYFKEAHTPLVRESLCQCFDEQSPTSPGSGVKSLQKESH